MCPPFSAGDFVKIRSIPRPLVRCEQSASVYSGGNKPSDTPLLAAGLFILRAKPRLQLNRQMAYILNFLLFRMLVNRQAG